VSSDPIATTDDGDSFNRYAYVGNDPMDRTDPSGNCAEDLCITEGVGALGLAAAYYGSAALVAAGVCEEACGAIHSWIGGKAAAVWNHVVHNESAPSDAPKADKPSAPPGNGGTTETPHGSPEHDAKVNEEVQKMQDKNYGDIRKNQAQVDAQGNKVENNRPDVQGTNPETGQREHVEVDRDPNRGLQHEQDILRNDPAGKCTRLPCP
jgi:hypothetical protein